MAGAIQSDGKIVVVGSTPNGDALLRLNTNGTLDTTFGNGGFATSKSIDAEVGNPSALALQSDGKILITSGTGAPTQIVTAPYLPSPQAGAIARYNTYGSLDKTFGISGQAACVAAAAAMGVQSDGKIVVAGAINAQLLVANNQTGFGSVRYNTDGSIDTSFGTGGGVITGFGSSFPAGSAFALAIQSNGEIVVAGMAGGGNRYLARRVRYCARMSATTLCPSAFQWPSCMK